MPRKSAIDRNTEAARALVACPASNWTNANIVAAQTLLSEFNAGSLSCDYDDAPFNALEEAMGAAPISSFPAALAKVVWLLEQPGGEAPARQKWEPSAYETLRDFLSPKEDFVAELGRRAGALIREESWPGADPRLEAMEALIEVSHPTGLAGVTVQVLMAIRNLLDIGAIARERTDEDLVDRIHRTQNMLEKAAPVLADIAGVDLDADYGAYYGTSCGEQQKNKRLTESEPDLKKAA